MDEMERDLKKLQGDYAVLRDKFSLISSVLCSKKVETKTGEYLKSFQKLLNEDFAEKFSAKEDTMTSDAMALLKLQEVEKELTEIVNFPMLSTKNIVAVAGGFSSGKSKFLNTIIQGGGIKLSVGINPVTAIPTFVLLGKEAQVTAYTPDGRQGVVPIGLFNKIDHKFIEDIGFNLKTIMPYVTVTSPFAEKLSKLTNLCIIDTPGYDPAKNESTEGDKKTTFDVLQFTSSLIWFVDIDSGTLRKNDTRFLHDLNEEKNKNLYVVISKADKKKSSIQDVIDRIKSDLEDKNIPFQGISAFSSNENKEYFDEEYKTSVYDFLTTQNSNVIDTAERIKDLTGKIDDVFQMYHDSIEKDLKEIEERRKDIRVLQLNYEKNMDKKEQKILELENNRDFDYFIRRMRNKINSSDMKDDFEDMKEMDFSKLIAEDGKRKVKDEENDKEAYRICLAMKNCVKGIFSELNPESVKKAEYKKFCDKCGTRLTDSYKFCPSCGNSTGSF